MTFGDLEIGECFLFKSPSMTGRSRVGHCIKVSPLRFSKVGGKDRRRVSRLDRVLKSVRDCRCTSTSHRLTKRRKRK